MGRGACPPTYAKPVLQAGHLLQLLVLEGPPHFVGLAAKGLWRGEEWSDFFGRNTPSTHLVLLSERQDARFQWRQRECHRVLFATSALMEGASIESPQQE